jgi:Arc/MetJ family transcription regulator
MATNLGIDEQLLAEAQRLGGHATKKATVNQALAQYIKQRKRLKSLDLIGKIEFDPKYDYKKSRRRK